MSPRAPAPFYRSGEHVLGLSRHPRLRADAATPPEATTIRELARYLALLDTLEALQAPLPIVFGHHDLLAGNFLDDGKRLWLIDWEYGGFGTAMFDLANLAANGNFSPIDDGRLLEAYFRQSVRDEIQRSFDSMKVASALREAAWAMVSAIHLAVPGVDYRAHATDYLARTEAALAHFVERHGSLAAAARPRGG